MFVCVCVFQIKNIVESIGLVLNIRCLACVGGTDVRGDLKKLESGPHVVVGTPARVCNMISRNALSKCPCFFRFSGKN